MNKQITEDYVSFETAKLLKEKGFDNEEVSENGGFYCDYKCDGTDIGIVYESQMLNKDLARNEYLRPTNQMALKWLREVYKLWIYADWCDDRGFQPNIIDIKNGEIVFFIDGTGLLNGYDNPSEVIEIALLYVLKNLI